MGECCQINAGETFSPVQLTLLLVVPANFFAIRALSLKSGELSLNIGAAKAVDTHFNPAQHSSLFFHPNKSFGNG
ncbi:hypothetical protein SY86_04070 [Erwinia tracheiphila]|uniref:Uncharacterized protein n=1 Tax=Erwinia tracheiphila TaxID=65700 RepID=A0A0M2KCR5_9GAMM|nr:hypothetical protein SY86_04070 [Erwinia tracheiphila]